MVGNAARESHCGPIGGWGKPGVGKYIKPTGVRGARCRPGNPLRPAQIALVNQNVLVILSGAKDLRLFPAISG